METEPTTPTPQRKKRRSNWNTEVARKRHAEQRRRLGRAAAERAEREHAEAIRLLATAKDRQLSAERIRRTNAVANGLSPRLIAVMKSWGITCNVSLTAGINPKAWTDHKRISVTYDQRLSMDEVIDSRSIRALAAETRGLFYHEVGHNLYSTQLPRLVRMAWDAGYIFAPNTATVRCELAPEDVQGRAAFAGVNMTVDVSSAFHRVWNALEDQRMETALVEESPVIAGYLTVAVLRLIAPGSSAWTLMAGRRYLPDDVRDEARRSYDLLLARSLGLSSDDVEALVREYCAATDAVTMIDCVTRLHAALGSIAIPVFDNHDQASNQAQREQAHASEDDEERVVSTGEANQRAQEKHDAEPPAAADEEPEAEEDEGPGSDDSSDAETEDDWDSSSTGGGADEDGEGDWDSDDDSQDDGDESGYGGNGQGGGPGSERSHRDPVEKAMDALEDDDTLDDDVAAVNEAYNVDDGALPVYDDVQPLYDDDRVAEAHGIVDDITSAFQIATADCAPHWESGQRRGVLEPIRYRTRQPGDLEFFRQYADSGEPGTDIAVSLFLDISGSMDGFSAMLGSTAWAIKTACHRINVDCDVTVFDNRGYRVWGIEDVPEEPVSIGLAGATDPTEAFTGVLSNERSKRHHIVLVMTDGMWDDKHALKNFRHSNTYSAVFYLDQYCGAGSLTPNPEMALSLLTDEAYTISDLRDIPQALERMLVSMV